MSAVVIALLAGVLIGAITGMPVGVINVSIIDAAAAGRVRFARGLAIGGGIADTIHAALAGLGVGTIVVAHPHAVRWLAIAAAAIIASYAVITLRSRRRPSTADLSPPPGQRAASDRATTGAATGLMLTLPNPAALAAWVTVVVTLWPDATYPVAIAFAAGVGIGSIAWFSALAVWIARLPEGHRARTVLPRVAIVALLVIAAIGLWRAV